MTTQSPRLFEDDEPPALFPLMGRTLVGWLTLRRCRFLAVSADPFDGEGAASAVREAGTSMLTRGVGDGEEADTMSTDAPLAFSARRFVGVVVADTEVDCGLTRDLPSEGGGVDSGVRVLVGMRALEMVRSGRRVGDDGREDEEGEREVVEAGDDSFGRRDLLKGR